MIDGTMSLVLDFVLFFAAFVVILILPGYLIANLFIPRRDFGVFERIPVAFSLSIAYASTLGILLHLFKSNVTVLMILLLTSVPLLVIANIYKKRRSIPAPPDKPGNSGETAGENEVLGTRFNLVIFGLMLLAFVVMLYQGAVLTWGADSIDHVGTVRQIVEGRQIFPTNAFYADEAGLGVDSRKGLYHTVLGIISIVTRIEPYQIWIWLPALLLPVLLCSFFAFSKEIFKNKNIALVSVIIFILCFEGVNRDLVRAAGYASRVAVVVYFTALLLLFKYLRFKKLSFLVACAFLGYTTGAVHIYYFVQYYLALFAFFVFACLFKWRDKSLLVSIIKVSVVTLLVSIPFLIIKYNLSYSTVHPSHAHLRHALLFTENVFVVNPVVPLNVIGPMGVFAFILTPFLYKRAKRDDGILFLFATMVATPLIIFNPLAVSFLGNLMTTGLVRRIIQLAPYISVIGFFTYQMIMALFVEHEKRNKVKALLFFALMILILFPYISQFQDDYKPSSRAIERRMSPLVWADAFEFLEDEIENPSVVLSDPWTSYSIPAFTKHYVVAVPFGHAPPKDAENVAKIRDAMNVLNPYTDMRTTMTLLDKHKAGYVVVNETVKTPAYGHAWSIIPELYEKTRQKFESHPGIFRKIYEEEKLRIYEYDSRADISELQIVESIDAPFRSSEEPDPRNVVDAVFEERFVLSGAVMDKDTVSSGDVLGIKCYWRTLTDVTSSKYYKVYVRFDTGYEKNALYNEHWSKIYRKLLQRVTGERYRFRSEHNPVNSVYPPTDWRTGETVLDEFEVKIPTGVSAGLYDVKITLMETPFGYNYDFSDLFTDEDIYDGVKIGSIFVGK